MAGTRPQRAQTPPRRWSEKLAIGSMEENLSIFTPPLACSPSIFPSKVGDFEGHWMNHH